MSELKQRLSDELDQLVARVRANKSFQELEQKYHALPDRDRLALNVLVLFLLTYLFYQMVLSPALGYLGSASKSYERQLEGYEWMVAQEPVVKEMLAETGTQREGSLLSVASSTAKKHNLNFSRFEPLDDDRVRLRLEQVKFNDIVSWLGELESEKGISAVDISLDSASPGYVSVRLTLQG